MTDDADPRLTELLRRNAPPVRDTLFRLQVLERRERRLFRHRVLLQFVCGLIVIVTAVIGVNIGSMNYEAIRFILLAVMMAVVCIVYAPVVTQLRRRFNI